MNYLRADAGADLLHTRSAAAFLPSAPPISRLRTADAVAAVTLVLALCVLSGLTLRACPASAQQFSADIVATTGAGRPGSDAGKLYVSNGAVHIETPGLPGSFLLVYADANSAYLIKPAQRIFMDAKQSSRLSQILIPLDPDDPCKEWQAMAVVAGAADHNGKWHCRRIGPENIAGRHVVKYQATARRGGVDYGWIDPRLGFPVMFQEQTGATIELVDIREGGQPAALFEIPANFRKFDPQLLIDRIKQSDVWVDPPK